MLDAAAISSAARAGWGGAERNGLHSLAKIPNRFPKEYAVKLPPPATCRSLSLWTHAAHARE